MPRSSPAKRDLLVSIVIPTQRRPAPLTEALGSAIAQILGDITAEIVVVDNDAAGSARALVQRMGRGATLPVRYVHAPEPGVAHARNVGVTAARGEFIAFLDDDEVASPSWLTELLAVQRQFDADVTFGPVRARLPEGLNRYPDYFGCFFSRVGPDEACTIMEGPGCGNSLVRKESMPHPTEPFARKRDGIGGEDDLLFATMKAAGGRFAWAPKAWVWEVPEPSRVRLGYTLRRSFTYGQGPSAAAYVAGPKRWALVPVWMGIGALQVVLYGGRAVIDAGMRSPDLAYTLDRVAHGFGKMLWFKPFHIRFYGLPAKAAPTSLPAPQGETHERHQSLEPRSGGKLRPRQSAVPAQPA